MENYGIKEGLSEPITPKLFSQQNLLREVTNSQNKEVEMNPSTSNKNLFQSAKQYMTPTSIKMMSLSKSKMKLNEELEASGKKISGLDSKSAFSKKRKYSEVIKEEEDLKEKYQNSGIDTKLDDCCRKCGNKEKWIEEFEGILEGEVDISNLIPNVIGEMGSIMLEKNKVWLMILKIKQSKGNLPLVSLLLFYDNFLKSIEKSLENLEGFKDSFISEIKNYERQEILNQFAEIGVVFDEKDYNSVNLDLLLERPDLLYTPNNPNDSTKKFKHTSHGGRFDHVADSNYNNKLNNKNDNEQGSSLKEYQIQLNSKSKSKAVVSIRNLNNDFNDSKHRPDNSANKDMAQSNSQQQSISLIDQSTLSNQPSNKKKKDDSKSKIHFLI